MRLLDHEPMEPDIAEELAAIDATLAGEPVDPKHAELAELALLLRAERPQMSDELSLRLDARAEQRFTARPARPRKRLFARTWVWAPAASALALGAGVAVLVVAAPFEGPGSSSSSSAASIQRSGPPSTSSAPAGATKAPTAALARGASAFAPGALAPVSGSTAGGLPLTTTGRKITQSSQLLLTAAPNRIDQVAQELYTVVGAESAIVQSSNVTQTGGLDGSATFQLSIPSPNLSVTMARLSDLPNSHVASRTDSTQDVTAQFDTLTGELAGAQALRTALLKQLTNAYTTAQIDGLTGQIHDVDGEIASYQAQLGGLNHQIAYSPVSVTINAAAVPVTHGSGFTIGNSWRTARHVLTVAAGVALIGLAVLLPLALVVALIWWIVATLRRRRREHVLDVA